MKWALIAAKCYDRIMQICVAFFRLASIWCAFSCRKNHSTLWCSSLWYFTLNLFFGIFGFWNIVWRIFWYMHNIYAMHSSTCSFVRLFVCSFFRVICERVCALFLRAHARRSLFTHIWAIMDRIINASARDSHHMPNTCAIFLCVLVSNVTFAMTKLLFIVARLLLVAHKHKRTHTHTNARTLKHILPFPRSGSVLHEFLYFWPFMRCNYIYSTVSISELYHSFFSSSRFLAFMVSDRNFWHGKKISLKLIDNGFWCAVFNGGLHL